MLQKPWVKTDGSRYIAGRPHSSCPDFADENTVRAWLTDQRVHFGIVHEDDHRIWACVDRTRSYPLFYYVAQDHFFLTDHPQHIRNGQPSLKPDQEALSIYLSSGFCAGTQTFLEGVKQLEPGEYLIWDKREKTLQVKAYYHYIPRFPIKEDAHDYKAELGNILDTAIKRVIKQADGREIYVPLSGGLDSRAVLCKLHEHSYSRIKTFSYGSRGNTDCETARDIAHTLNVPWRYIEPSHKDQRAFFESRDGTDFLQQASRFSSGPSFTDFFALRTLHQEGEIGPDTLMVNGQSGDYITGGHLPLVAQDHDSESKLYSFFMKKHFSVWQSLSPQKGKYCCPFVDAQHARFLSIAPPLEKYLSLYSFFNWLEWRERQSKYVVACQFNYNYFDCEWALPLWDSDLMDFYEDLPFDIFIDQKLYIDYLQTWNYRNLFSFVRRTVNPWPRNRTLVLGAGRAIGLLAGNSAKERFYKFMRYWSTQDVHYRLMPISAWLKIWNNIQNAEGFYALEGLTRSGIEIDWDERFKDARDLVTNHMRIMP